MFIRWSPGIRLVTVAGQINWGCFGSIASNFCPSLKRFFSGFIGC